MKVRLIAAAVGVLTVLGLACPDPAQAYWTVGAEADPSNSAVGRAASLQVPADLSASLGSNSITISWDTPGPQLPGVTYEVDRSSASGTVQTCVTAANSCVDNTAGGVFTYTVTAGLGHWRSSAVDIPDVLYDPPSQTPPSTTFTGAPYSYTFQFFRGPASTGTTYELASGSLPPGLTLTASGELSGIAVPSQQKVFAFRVKGTNSGVGVVSNQIDITVAEYPADTVLIGDEGFESAGSRLLTVPSNGSVAPSVVAAQIAGPPWGVAYDGDGNAFVAEGNVNGLGQPGQEVLYLQPSIDGMAIARHDSWSVEQGVITTLMWHDNILYAILSSLDGTGRVAVIAANGAYVAVGDVVDDPGWAPQGLAFDALGHLYVSETSIEGDNSIGRVVELTRGSSGTTATTILDNIDPSGIAVDPLGTVYVADAVSRQVLRIPANDRTDTSPVADLATGLPSYLALDDAGRLIVGDAQNVHAVDLQTGADTVLAPNVSTAAISVYVPQLLLAGEAPSTTARVGTAYSFTYHASYPYSSNSPAITFTVASGSLPPGLSLNADTGELSGVPTEAGTSDFTIAATNPATGDSVEQDGFVVSG